MSEHFLFPLISFRDVISKWKIIRRAFNEDNSTGCWCSKQPNHQQTSGSIEHGIEDSTKKGATSSKKSAITIQDVMLCDVRF